MTRPRNRELFTLTLLLSSVLVFCLATAKVSSAQVSLTTLVTFDGADGSTPDYMVLTQGADGNFYGTTYEGGASYGNGGPGYGSVFKVTPGGTLTTLYSFCPQAGCVDGAYPLGSLVQAANGDFYGTTSGGGAYSGGTVFKITTLGTLTTLYNFCALVNCADGVLPLGALVQGRSGNFYGATQSGGANSSPLGTVFEITPEGKLTTLYSFCSLAGCADGYYPSGGLVQAVSGNFYGVTTAGGSSSNCPYTGGCGTVFEIDPEGSLTTLFSFNGVDGIFPSGGLIQATNGDLYGVTVNGGDGSVGEGCPEGCGTVFKITAGGKLTSLYTFCTSTITCEYGGQPFGPLVQGTDGNFYGTTYGGFGDLPSNAGTIFEITPEGSLTKLYNFCAARQCADGFYPTSGLLQATNGIFYGTTSEGGINSNGTIFSLSTGLSPFVKTEPKSAKEGARVGIFGQGFTSSSVVQFGGVPATNVKLSGSTFLFATVPAGALTGSVTVTTGGTTLTSNQQFRVKPQLLTFNPPSGSVGTQVTITGTGFTQTNGVGFGDNVPAQFTINSDTQVTATVPVGAKTGPIGVVTKGGTAISSATFTVN